ncbi:MAG: arginine decarboxylase, pyruvoyl-dependent [Candidatus Omnitrophica bacterium CG1_02_40_15]|nr:MAG: arginine decarboxylase, pyruvoyl-dependent [Candidatus Omnitrophica bacterium CG1_02_40_15]
MNGQQAAQSGKLVPTKVFFTKGVGTHKEELRSYELALRDAGIEKCNLVHVSSIFPPGCKILPKNEGIKELIPGMITYCVIARCSSNEPRRLIASSVGTAIPADENMYGYMSEHHAYGQTDEFAGDYAEDLAAKMLASTMGFPDFDDSKDWDEIKKVYQVKDKIVKTMNMTQSTIIDSNGSWSTVVSAAVFLF